jgi:hypothetical protein
LHLANFDNIDDWVALIDTFKGYGDIIKGLANSIRLAVSCGTRYGGHDAR